jgi:hypothetical protein
MSQNRFIRMEDVQGLRVMQNLRAANAIERLEGHGQRISWCLPVMLKVTGAPCWA